MLIKTFYQNDIKIITNLHVRQSIFARKYEFLKI